MFNTAAIEREREREFVETDDRWKHRRRSWGGRGREKRIMEETEGEGKEWRVRKRVKKKGIMEARGGNRRGSEKKLRERRQEEENGREA